MSDKVVALDFDLACTMELVEYDKEKHQQLIEALAASATVNTLSHLVPHK
jgi:hypothetical protein